tara:strand:- start:410 stop:640 length:231 start_codon:yes stop_codon:yes gene_type:complete
MTINDTLKRNYRYKNIPETTLMSQLIFGGLLTTSAPTAPIVGIASIVLFAIVGIMVGPDYDGMNAPSIDTKKDTSK